MKKVIWLLILMVMVTSLQAQERTRPINPSIDSMLPASPSTYLTDMAGVVRNPTLVNERLRFLKDSLKLSLVAVTMKSTGRFEPSEVAREIGRYWLVATKDSIGSELRNTGGVILLVIDSHKCRVEVATGSEGYVTDSRAANLCRDAAPMFKAGAFDQGIVSIANGFAEYHVASISPKALITSPAEPKWPLWLLMLINAVIFGIILYRIFHKQEEYFSTEDLITRYEPPVQVHTPMTTSRTYYTEPVKSSAPVEQSTTHYVPPVSSRSDDDSYRRSTHDSGFNSSPSSDTSWSSGGSDSFSGGGGGSDW
jgi:uncharacterized membrane protein YgcG